jgi:hypothetical protein
LNNDYDFCLLLRRLHHCGGLVVSKTNVVKIQHIHNWPFPAECPPKPWTPEQQRKYAEEQLKNVPESPL